MRLYAIAIALALFSTTATANRIMWDGSSGSDWVGIERSDWHNLKMMPGAREWGVWGEEEYTNGIEAYMGRENDFIYGTPEEDAIFGQAGGDKIYGGAGNDYLHGGAGEDYLYGGDGNDILVGGMGHDTLDGGPGDDIMIGGPGEDYYFDCRCDSNNVAVMRDFHSDFIMSTGAPIPYIKEYIALGSYEGRIELERVRVVDMTLPTISAAGRNLTLHHSGFREYGYRVTAHEHGDGTEGWTNVVNAVVLKRKK